MKITKHVSDHQGGTFYILTCLESKEYVDYPLNMKFLFSAFVEQAHHTDSMTIHPTPEYEFIGKVY